MAAGKSTALAILRELGAQTLSTDQVVHDLYAGPELTKLVVDRWGSDVAPNGKIDRDQIALKAFASDSERKWLESQIWPMVGAAVWEFRQNCDQLEPRPKAAIVEVPLLFEAGMEAAYDATIAVIAGDKLRAQRADQRGGGEALAERESRQMPQDEKAARATYTAVNDGSLQELRSALDLILNQIVLSLWLLMVKAVVEARPSVQRPKVQQGQDGGPGY